MAYSSRVIDVPFVVLDESPPDHGGPEGRLTQLKDVQVTHYTPGAPGVVPTMLIEPREAFVSMPSAMRDGSTGAVDGASTWNNPELLDSLGDQLLSICNSTPRVWNGTSWTSYPGSRVVTNKLSQDILHTTNHVLQAGDSARIGNVTCFVWSESIPSASGPLCSAMVAFRGDDGAWIRTPFALDTTAANLTTMVRVVSDGTQFWVVYNNTAGHRLYVSVFDTHGVITAQDLGTIPCVWGALPGYWDVQAAVSGSYALVIQPTANTTTGTDVHASWWKLTVSGAVITITTGAFAGTATPKCSGPLAFQKPPGSSLGYFASVGVAGALWSYEFNATTFAITREYSFGTVINGSTIPDGLTGWVDGNLTSWVAFSVLSNFSPPAGPLNDPGLRYVRSYSCTSGGSVALVNQTNGVLLSSRAFQIDNDWYAATYYQSGGGNATSAVSTIAVNGATDYFTGPVVQPVPVQDGDYVSGSGFTIGTADVYATQGIAAIVHDPTDVVSIVTGAVQWQFLNAHFAGAGVGFGLNYYASATWLGTNTAIASILHVAGAANAGNNGDWFVQAVGVGDNICWTDLVSLQGNTAVAETFGAGVTASLSQSWVVVVPVPPNPAAVGGYAAGNVSQPRADLVPNFIGGVATISGASGAAVALNGSYTVRRIALEYIAAPNDNNLLVLGKTSGSAGTSGGHYVLGSTSGASGVVAPLLSNRWVFGNPSINIPPTTRVAFSLVDSGDVNAGNNGTFPVGTTGSGRNVDTPGQTSLVAERFTSPNRPTISIVLSDPGKAMVFHLANAAFDATFLGAYLSLAGAVISTVDNGIYQIVNIIDSTTVVVVVADGHTAQVVYNMTGAETVSISKAAGANTPAFQPCWFLMPLSISQRVAGRWEWGTAFGDWRFDGKTKANTSSMERNGFPLALSSVVASADGLQLVLPYRVQSFTAGQIVSDTQTQVGLAFTPQSTVGLKLFNISAIHGQSIPGEGKMLLPGMQASQLSGNAFPEDGINIGPEVPFVVAQATIASPFALTLKVPYQWVVVFELTTEVGDRTWSTVSPPLDITTSGANNQVTIGGRMPGPTNRVVGVAIYRTSNIGGIPTVRHYKITNDLDINGAGFTFTSVNGGAQSDTWQFVDNIPDPSILSAEVVYTDKALLQRFPAPAYSQGVSAWKARDWVVGYDGAIWMSGEKVEGDAVWWHPAFRYTAFGDDTPVSVCPMDDYLIVHCEHSAWYIPAATFPDATGRNGELPNPVQLPNFPGGTGFALALREGVVYSSEAGGVWLITRALENVWLSEALRDSLTTVTGMAIDKRQRLVICDGSDSLWVYDQVSKGWWQWSVPGANDDIAVLVATLAGQIVYADGQNSPAGPPVLYTPSVYLDNVAGSTSGIAMDVTYSSLEFGKVRAFKCLWAAQIVGEYRGPHRLNAVMSYPDDDHALTTFGPFTPSGSGPYIFEINPMLEEASVYTIRLFVDFSGVATPGQSCALELISFEIGFEPGLNRMVSTRRISGT